MSTIHNLSQAAEDFRRARQQAGLQGLLSRWKGKSLDLLSFEEVRRQLRATGAEERGLQQIPLDAIVGSVGRYRDFTRTFLPKLDADKDRWSRVLIAQTSTGLAPISVYQIGEAYFVLDGNHRVSVARSLGSSTIEAYVTEIKTLVPLSPEDQADDIILKAEYADFLAQTRLDVLRPEVDLALTSPGKYPLLLEHIEVHRYYMGIAQERAVSYEEAVIHWCDEVYLPTVQLIRESGLARDFPSRTETDLYVWLADRRAEIEEFLGWEVSTGEAVAEMADSFRKYRPQSLLRKAILGVAPGAMEREGSLVNRWRRERLTAAVGESFFRTLLVPLDGNETSWLALEQAYVLARREASHIIGLFVLERDGLRHTILTSAFQREFEERCKRAETASDFITEVGDFEKLIMRRERWSDLVVLKRDRSGTPEAGLQPRLKRLVQNASGLTLIVTDEITSFQRPLLAYNGTPASREALYLAAYFGSQWNSPVTVLHVGDKEEDGAIEVAHAAEYLAGYGVEVDTIRGAGNVPAVIGSTAENRLCDVILMGSPRLNPVLGIGVGETVKELLHDTGIPLVLCR